MEVMLCIFGFCLVLNYSFQCKLPQILKLILVRESVHMHASREGREGERI